MSHLQILPDDRVCSFHEGQIWANTKDRQFHVSRVEGGKAFLRSVDGNSRVTKKWDAIGEWTIVFDPKYPKFRNASISLKVS